MTDQKNDDLPDECKKAFEHWLSKKSLSAATDEDAWGQEIYKYPKIEAMWYAWKGVWNTRAQPVADDAGGDELDVHDRLRHMTDDFKMSQHQCRHQSEQISALQVELAQAKAALRQPAAAGAQATPGNRGVDVEKTQDQLANDHDISSLLGVIADIRKAAGVKEKPMLYGLADAIKAEIDNRDKIINTTMAERDDNCDMADVLAHKLSQVLGVDIGEHGHLNDPWQNAIDCANALLAKSSAFVKSLEDKDDE